MRKKAGIALIIILSLSLLIYFRNKTNNEKIDDKNNSNVMSEEVKAKIINKNSNDLYRDVIISKDNDFHGRKLNSQFSFTLLLDKDDKINSKTLKIMKLILNYWKMLILENFMNIKFSQKILNWLKTIKV